MESEHCRHCGGQPTLKVPETVKHILVDCPDFSLIRQDLLGASDRDTMDLLCDAARVEKLINFILRTHTRGQFRTVAPMAVDQGPDTVRTVDLVGTTQLVYSTNSRAEKMV